MFSYISKQSKKKKAVQSTFHRQFRDFEKSFTAAFYSFQEYFIFRDQDLLGKFESWENIIQRINSQAR